MIATDQATKMKLLMNLNLVKDKASDYDTTWAEVFNAIRIPSTVMMVTFAAIELAGGDLFDGILDSMMVVMDMVQNIMTIIHDQQEIK